MHLNNKNHHTVNICIFYHGCFKYHICFQEVYQKAESSTHFWLFCLNPEIRSLFIQSTRIFVKLCKNKQIILDFWDTERHSGLLHENKTKSQHQYRRFSDSINETEFSLLICRKFISESHLKSAQSKKKSLTNFCIAYTSFTKTIKKPVDIGLLVKTKTNKDK